MTALFILAIIAWSILPYKAWSRFIFGGDGFNLGDLVLLLILGTTLLDRPRWRGHTTLWPWIVLLWVLLLFGALRGAIAGESIRDIGRVLRGGAFWIIVPLMVHTLTSEERLRAWLGGMGVVVLVAAGTLVAFSYFPGLVPAEEEVGVVRNELVGGFERVFTLGMWSVYAGAIVALSAVLFRRGRRVPSALFLVLLLIALAFTFARTFAVGLALAAVVLLLLGDMGTLLIATTGGVAVTLLGLAAGLPGFLVRLGRAVSDRAMLFLTETPDYAFQTFFWRLSEFLVFSESMATPADRLFGVLGRVYVLPDGYTASMPHIGYLGVYFGFGFAGVAVYGLFLAAVTARVAVNAVRLRGTRFHWISAGSCAAWFGLLAAAAAAPVFHFAWGVAALAFAAGLSETAASLQRSSDASSLDQHRHPLPQRGTVHPENA